MVGNFVAEAFLAKIIVIVGGNLVGGSFLPENHERGVDGDAREPSCETGPAVKVGQVNKGPQEGVLHCVFRILRASGDAARSAKKLMSMSLGKGGEGGGMPALGGLHQALVAQSVSACP